MLGLVIALIAVGLALITDNPVWDGGGTVAIGVLLGIIAVILAIEMRSLLIGESASTRDRDAIIEAIEGAPHVERLIHIKTQHLGPEELLVAAKVAFPPNLSFGDVAAAIDELENSVRQRVPYARSIYIEPDVDRDRDGTSGS